MSFGACWLQEHHFIGMADFVHLTTVLLQIAYRGRLFALEFGALALTGFNLFTSTADW